MAKFKPGVFSLALGVAAALLLVAIKWLGAPAESAAVVPLPQHLSTQRGHFRLGAATRLEVEPTSQSAAELLARRLRIATGFALPVLSQRSSGVEDAGILLTSKGAHQDLGPEGYELEVTPGQVRIRATGEAGFFYATQTLLELLPARMFSVHAVVPGPWLMPCVRVEDRPRFTWRGAMLDVSRHFFTVDEVKKFLDVMALHKLNVFHWHLTDDQGWRIEIKKYPRLTQVGAWRKRIGFNLDPKSSTAYGPDARYGGFYTQDQVREIVAYAQERHITVLPEIEMPGHSSAALAAYPQFSCSGGPYTTDMSEAVSAGVYCAGKDATFTFLEDVLTEVRQLFPGEFIHIGGDEVPRHNWHNCPLCQARIKQEGLANERDLESYFVRRIETFLNAHNRRVIGWSEIRNDQLAPSTAVMDWIGGGTEAAQAGHDVVMCPEEYCYLDFYQSLDRSREPTAAGAYLPLSKAYAFEPVPANLGAAARPRILGAQGNLWTEYIPSASQLEYMAFPRLSALSEVFWSPKPSRNWRDFARRLSVHEQRLKQLDVNFRPEAKPP
ncbi:MAG TPA: beta-N-acetylhexosaminidase [Verrucomicrobiae bacterium]|nr:beta-N-acetylhexosaminidase [Verrucomicrobiae bacterium]